MNFYKTRIIGNTQNGKLLLEKYCSNYELEIRNLIDKYIGNNTRKRKLEDQQGIVKLKTIHDSIINKTTKFQSGADILDKSYYHQQS